MEVIKKNILLLSTGDINGAYEAIYKMAKLFYAEGHQVTMLVKHKTQSDSFVVKYQSVDEKKSKTFPMRIISKVSNIISKQFFINQKVIFNDDYLFLSIDESSTNVSAKQVIKLIGYTPDYIFTGMTIGFMNSTDLLNIQQLTKAQIYNFTVDMNHFTGGCHYAWDCKGYINGCSQACPAILSKQGKDIAKVNFETKLSNAKKGDFRIIAGSGWTLKQAQESKIYKNQHYFPNINSLIDTKLMNAAGRKYAKDIFSLDTNKFYILMGCQHTNDPRKGFEYLLESLIILKSKLSYEQQNRVSVLIVSKSKDIQFDSIPFQKAFIDYIKDYRLLSLLYQASDVFVNSSIEDSGPMMVSEALACGTPVVGFDMGVVNNMVINGFNGYKANLKDSSDLAQGIQSIFDLSKEEYKVYSQNGVNKVEAESSFNFAKSVFDTILST
jgi:glycosyltransferase involved in cell wall biosynthesis